MIVRDSYWKMMKDGKYRAFRNLPVGWVLQIIHSTDKTERLVRIVTEIILILAIWYSVRDVSAFGGLFLNLLWVFLIIHTISWFFIGNFWVYMLDSFKWVHNPGITRVLSYIGFVRRVIMSSGSCDAILVYGSMSRGAFHGRSDLDLRIIRKKGIFNGVLAVFAGIIVRIPAAFQRNPVDLQVVDSLEFLDTQMRSDEHPIIVYLSSNIYLSNPGPSFDEILKNPEQVLKDNSDNEDS